MKKLLLLGVILISLPSCSNQSIEQIIEKKATEYIKKDMNDPDSFEFVEIVSIDTLYAVQILDTILYGVVEEKRLAKDAVKTRDSMIVEIDSILFSLNSNIADSENKVKNHPRGYILKSSLNNLQKSRDNLLNMKKDANERLHKLHAGDSIAEIVILKLKNRIDTTPKDSILGISVVIKSRGTNSYGAKILSEQDIWFNSKLEPTSVEESLKFMKDIEYMMLSDLKQ